MEVIKLIVRWIMLAITLLFNFAFLTSPNHWPTGPGFEMKLIKLLILILFTLGFMLTFRFILHFRRTYRKEDWYKNFLNAAFFASLIPAFFFPHWIY